MDSDFINILTDMTELGNVMLLGILSVVLLAYLFLIGYRREPLAMLLGFIAPVAVIGFLKITFYICNSNLWGVVSPSGHAAISIGVYGISALILAKICTGMWRIIIPIFLVTLAAVIAISRSILRVHTDGDVIVGSLIGCVIVLVIAKTILNERLKFWAGGGVSKKKAQPAAIFLLVTLVMVLCYGVKLQSEKTMKHIAKEIRTNFPICN